MLAEPVQISATNNSYILTDITKDQPFSNLSSNCKIIFSIFKTKYIGESIGNLHMVDSLYNIQMGAANDNSICLNGGFSIAKYNKSDTMSFNSLLIRTSLPMAFLINMRPIVQIHILPWVNKEVKITILILL